MRKTKNALLAERERGAGTIQTLGYFVVLAVVFFALVTGGAMMQAKHRAQTGADLGAIAGAQAISQGESRAYACEHAARIAHNNKAEVLSCDIAGKSVTLNVQTQPSLSALPVVHARAVAAPQEP